MYSRPVGNAEATRARILAAATAEFAQHGLAGARVERIATAAQANQAQLYHYFGNKESLFDAAFWAYVRNNTDTIPLDARDLPGWAVAIHDNYLRDPALVRLATWARLEREPTGDLFARRGGINQWTLDSIADAQQEGVLVDTIEPIDLFCMTIALAGTWAQASITIAGVRSEVDDARRRDALHDTIQRAFCR